MSYECKHGHVDNYRLNIKGHKVCVPCRDVAAKKWRILHPDRAKKNAKANHSLSVFGRMREEVIQRDGEKCVECSMSRETHLNKYGYDITVDHIDGNGINVAREDRNNSLDNLQTLCASCHGRKDNARRKTVGNRHKTIVRKVAV